MSVRQVGILLWTLHAVTAYYGVISPEDSIRIVQTQTIQNFEYVAHQVEGKYMLVEVFFEDQGNRPQPTVLCASSAPLTSYESVAAAEYIDFSGWYDQKSYHYLQLPGIDSHSHPPLYVAVYSNITLGHTGVQYRISLTVLNSPLCPNNCFDHGRCDQGNCVCDSEGYFQPTCDVLALRVDETKSLIVENNQVIYLYAPTEDMSDGSLRFEWTSGYPVIVSKEGLCGYQTMLASDYEHYEMFTAVEASGTYRLPGTRQRCSNSEYWTFRISQNRDFASEMVVLSLTLESSSDSSSPSIMLIVIALVGALVFLAWASFLLYRLRLCYRRRSQRIAQSTSSSLERMRRSCPLRKVQTLPKTQRDRPCAICLEDFSEKCEVRVLPCDHAYHTHCIDQWFVRHSNCCFCKVDIFKFAEGRQASEVVPTEMNELRASESGMDRSMQVVDLH